MGATLILKCNSSDSKIQILLDVHLLIIVANNLFIRYVHEGDVFLIDELLSGRGSDFKPRLAPTIQMIR